MIVWFNFLVIFFAYFISICLATCAKTLKNFIYAGIISGITGLFFSVISMLLWFILAMHSLDQRAAGRVAPLNMLIDKIQTNAAFLLTVWIIISLIMTAVTVWIPLINYSRAYKKRIILGIFIANIVIISMGFLLLSQ